MERTKGREAPLYMKAFLPVAEGLSQMLGSRYEVILHDLTHVESSIVAIYGNITNRQVGGPATNYLLQLLHAYGDDAPNSLNYRNVMPDGRVLRSSTIFIRDPGGHIVGSLCINQDLTDFIVASKLSQELTAFQQPLTEEDSAQEFFAHDITDVMKDMVRTELELLQKPVAYMQKEDKLAVVRRMEEKGIFNVKGAVEHVAERLGVTNYTVYNYLKSIRSEKRESKVTVPED